MWKSLCDRSRLLVVAACLLVMNASVATRAVRAEDDPAAKPRYTFKKIHDRNGIGKFYMGREIAHVMGYAGVGWLERPEREREEKLSLLVKSLQLKPSMIVADIGAGSGVITLRMAEELGDDGKVLAVDIQKEMLDRLRKKLKAEGVTNVELVKGTRKSPKLPKGKVDLVVLVDVYHEFDYPYEMLREISRALKVGGRVAFVEYRKEDPTVPIKLVHKMTEAQVKKEAAEPELHLKWKQTIGVLPLQHIVLFEKTEAPKSDDR